MIDYCIILHQESTNDSILLYLKKCPGRNTGHGAASVIQCIIIVMCKSIHSLVTIAINCVFFVSHTYQPHIQLSMPTAGHKCARVCAP